MVEFFYTIPSNVRISAGYIVYLYVIYLLRHHCGEAPSLHVMFLHH